MLWPPARHFGYTPPGAFKLLGQWLHSLLTPLSSSEVVYIAYIMHVPMAKVFYIIIVQ